MRALVVDDHPLIQDAVTNVLRQVEPAMAIDIALDCERGLELAGRGPQPELVLLDLTLPGVSGIPAVRIWRDRYPGTALVVLSATADQPTMLAAFRAGAVGYIPKSSSNEIMLSALRLVLDGGRYLPPDLLSPVGAPNTRQRPRQTTGVSLETLGLTVRQMQVLRLIAKGAPNKTICRELCLAERTVKSHITAVFRALKVTSRTQAAIEAAKLGLVERGS